MIQSQSHNHALTLGKIQQALPVESFRHPPGILSISHKKMTEFTLNTNREYSSS
jgi:hypothetical protein